MINSFNLNLKWKLSFYIVNGPFSCKNINTDINYAINFKSCFLRLLFNLPVKLKIMCYYVEVCIKTGIFVIGVINILRLVCFKQNIKKKCYQE